MGYMLYVVVVFFFLFCGSVGHDSLLVGGEGFQMLWKVVCMYFVLGVAV